MKALKVVLFLAGICVGTPSQAQTQHLQTDRPGVMMGPGVVGAHRFQIEVGGYLLDYISDVGKLQSFGTDALLRWSAGDRWELRLSGVFDRNQQPMTDFYFDVRLGGRYLLISQEQHQFSVQVEGSLFRESLNQVQGTSPLAVWAMYSFSPIPWANLGITVGALPEFDPLRATIAYAIHGGVFATEDLYVYAEWSGVGLSQALSRRYELGLAWRMTPVLQFDLFLYRPSLDLQVRGFSGGAGVVYCLSHLAALIVGP